MAEFPTYEQMAKNVAEKALDEILYQGKSIREWAKIITEQEPCEDAISRVETVKFLANHSNEFEDAKIRIAFQSASSLVNNPHNLPPVQPKPKTGHCRDCKYWKDSDGAFRRGVNAESPCPINRIEVYEGDGYCFLFKPMKRGGEG